MQINEYRKPFNIPEDVSHFLETVVLIHDHLNVSFGMVQLPLLYLHTSRRAMRSRMRSLR
jgi:peptidyl-tRNA hydrolase